MKWKNINKSKLIDLICFIAGPSIICFCLLGKRSYGYPIENRVGIALGIGLLAFGFLYRSWGKMSKEKSCPSEITDNFRPTSLKNGASDELIKEEKAQVELEQPRISEKTEAQMKYIKSMKELDKKNPLVKATQLYSSYDEVPFYRKQWFFWLIYFPLQPIAIAILLFGDVYYLKKGEVKSFGLANRIIAGLAAIAILCKIFKLV